MSGAEVGGGVICALGGLDAVKAVGIIHDPGQVGDQAAPAEEVVEVEFQTVGVNGGVGVLVRAPVIQGDAAQGVRCVGCINFGRPGLIQGGRRGKALGCEHDFAETVEIEVFRDDQVLREGDQHALEAFEVFYIGNGQRNNRRLRQSNA